MSAGRINAIQGLRGIAALLVVSDHSILGFSEKTNLDLVGKDHLTYIAETLGRHGVEMFFLISGFVMTVSSYEDFRRPKATSAFVWRRIIRIVPLYWLVTALAVALALWRGHFPSIGEVAKSLAFIPYENERGLFQPIVRRGWTLNYEMFFYALFAIALFQRPRRGLTAVISLLVLLTAIGRLWVTDKCAMASCSLMSFYTQPIMLYFAGGIILGAIRLSLQHRNKMPAVRFDNGLGMAIVLTAVYVAYVSNAAPSNVTYVVGVIFCVLTTAFCALLEDTATGGRIGIIFLLVGEASYSIYMTHTIFVDPVSRLWFPKLGSLGIAPYLAAMIVGTSLLGMLTFRYVERPTLRALRRH